MTRLKHSLLAASAFSLLASASFADISADDVWNDWKSYLSGLGYEVSWTEARDGSNLIVSDFVVKSQMDAETGSGQITIGTVTFAEQSDGSVDITMPEVMPIAFTAPSDNGGQTDVKMEYRQSGMDISVSGTPAALQYEYAADTITVLTTEMVVDGKVMSPDENGIELGLSQFAGTMDMALEGKRRYDQALTAGKLDYTMNVADPETSSTFALTGAMDALAFSGTSALPLRVVQADDMDAMLAAGFSVDGTFGYTANDMEFSATSPDGPAAGTVGATDGSVKIQMDQDGVSYSASQSNTSVAMTSADFPFPLSFDIAKSLFSLSTPVRQSETADDFAVGLTLDGFEMSDMLWGLFDPTAQLPRDPATVILDIAGRAKLMFDVLNPDTAALAANPENAPAEFENVDINKLQISAAGADLTGSGAFTFDNTTTPPKPVGAIDLTLVGGNALIDKLVAIGIIQEEEAMGARMMMGLLAVPGDSPDTLKSKIEMNEQGHISANGQRIR